MLPDKIYLDNTSLVRWFLKRFYPKKYKRDPQIIRFLNEHKEIDTFVSILSVAELVHTLKHGEEFKKFGLKFDHIKGLIEELQNIIGFEIIQTVKINDTQIDGIVISGNIIKYVFKHRHLADCIHLDIARQNEIWFVTYEKRMGELKEYYENIMTEDKLMKQYKGN